MKYHRFLCTIASIAAVGLFHLSHAQTNALNATGNVGVGTASPATSLHVVGPFTPGLMQVAVRSTGADDRSGISFYNNAGNRNGVLYLGIDDLILGKDGTGKIRFVSAGADRLSIDSAGNVGINWPSPNARLDVQGVSNSALRLFDGPTDTSTIDFQRSADGWKLGQLRMAHAGNYGANLSIKLHPNDGAMTSAPVDVLTILSNGNVGIGTTNPTHKLSVNGTIRAKEVVVETTGWSDYVFADDYTLVPLSEVEQQIKANKRLPGLPSADDVAAHGIGIGEMQAKLLAKIEEITLHQIAQAKEIAKLRAQNSELENQLKKIAHYNSLPSN